VKPTVVCQETRNSAVGMRNQKVVQLASQKSNLMYDRKAGREKIG